MLSGKDVLLYIDAMQEGGWFIAVFFLVLYWLERRENRKDRDAVAKTLDARHDEVVKLQKDAVAVAAASRDLIQRLEQKMIDQERQFGQARELLERSERAISRCESK